MFAILKNGLMYGYNGRDGYIFTFNKQKADDRFIIDKLWHDEYKCPLDQILPEIEEAFDYRFFALCDVFVNVVLI